MTPWRITRIVLALCGIFAAGVLVGRWTAPAPKRTMVHHPSNRRGKPIEVTASDGATFTSAGLTQTYSRLLGLAPAQRAEIALIVRDHMAAMKKSEPGSPARLEAMRRLNAAVRPRLTPAQQEKFDAAAREAEDRWNERHRNPPH